MPHLNYVNLTKCQHPLGLRYGTLKSSLVSHVTLIYGDGAISPWDFKLDREFKS